MAPLRYTLEELRELRDAGSKTPPAGCPAHLLTATVSTHTVRRRSAAAPLLHMPSAAGKPPTVPRKVPVSRKPQNAGFQMSESELEALAEINKLLQSARGDVDFASISIVDDPPELVTDEPEPEPEPDAEAKREAERPQGSSFSFPRWTPRHKLSSLDPNAQPFSFCQHKLNAGAEPFVPVQAVGLEHSPVRQPGSCDLLLEDLGHAIEHAERCTTPTHTPPRDCSPLSSGDVRTTLKPEPCQLPPVPASAKQDRIETDLGRLVQRERQMVIARGTQGYQNMLKAIANGDVDAEAGFAKVPNIYQLASKRSWDAQVRRWRNTLHGFDDYGSETWSLGRVMEAAIHNGYGPAPQKPGNEPAKADKAKKRDAHFEKARRQVRKLRPKRADVGAAEAAAAAC